MPIMASDLVARTGACVDITGAVTLETGGAQARNWVPNSASTV